MTENKRFRSEYYSVGYYTEIVDNEKELEDVPNPKKNLTIGEVVDTLNELHEENQRLTDKLNRTALELVGVISQGKAVEISEMSYVEFLDYRAENGKPMELQL